MDGKIVNYFNPILMEQGLSGIKELDVDRILLSVDGGNQFHLPCVMDCINEFKDLGILEEAYYNAFSLSRTNNCHVSLDDQRFALSSLLDKEILRSLGDPIPPNNQYELFRGVAGHTSNRKIRGLSWTGGLEVAAWFA